MPKRDGMKLLGLISVRDLRSRKENEEAAKSA